VFDLAAWQTTFVAEVQSALIYGVTLGVLVAAIWAAVRGR